MPTAMTMMKKKSKDAKPKKRKPTPKVRFNKERHVIITPVCRLSFPKLFTPTSFADEDKKTYSCDLIVDDEKEWSKPYKGTKAKTISLTRAIQNALEDRFGTDESKWPEMQHPVILDGDDNTIGDTDEVLEGYEGKSYIRPRTGENFPPRLLLKNGQQASDGDLYGGCYVRAQICVSPYDTGTNAGVSLRLMGIMFEKDGDKFGSGANLFDVSEDEELDDEGEDDEEWI